MKKVIEKITDLFFTAAIFILLSIAAILDLDYEDITDDDDYY